MTSPAHRESPHFEAIFSPGHIGNVDVRNRLCMAPIGTRYANDDGYVTGRQIDFYAERAHGGIGLVIVEATYIHPYPGRMLISDDRFIPGLRRLADAIREGGARSSIEIQTRRGRSDKSEPVGPSAIAHPRTGVMPRALTKDDIARIGDDFASAARRAQDAGFDCIEIHGASGYLLNEFLSQLANRRTDEYGGSLGNRARLAIEIIGKVRNRVAKDFPIIYRQCASEHVDGGISIDEAVAFARMLEDAGVDAIEVVSGSTVHSPEWIVIPLGLPPGANVDAAAAIRAVVSIPVIVGGNLADPELAERVLSSGRADFISLGKALIADPAYPRKLAEGRLGAIRPCIHCLHCIDPRIRDNVGIRCTTNPATGQESAFPLRPAIRTKAIAVVGAGPAGISASLVLAQRGHRVTLIEQSDGIGGDLRLDSFSPYVEESAALIAYWDFELARCGVDVVTGVHVDAGSAEIAAAQTVIVATGGVPMLPMLAGGGADSIISFRDVLAGWQGSGLAVVVLGSGIAACKVAEYLQRMGNQVTLIEQAPVFGWTMEESIRRVTLARLEQAGISMLAAKGVDAIAAGEVRFADVDVFSVRADLVVAAIGVQPDAALHTELLRRGIDAYAVGSCATPGTLAGSIQLGFQQAFEIR